MALIHLCLLTFISLTQAKTPCRCNGKISSLGGGECKTSHKGHAWCYIDSTSDCSDRNRGWSYQACRNKRTCACNGFISNEGGGECRTLYRGKAWCFIDKDAECSDRNRGWSHQACQDKTDSSEGKASLSKSNECKVSQSRGCIFPFKHNNQIYDKCTLVEGSKAWCATELDHKGRVKTKGDCSEELSSPHCFPSRFWDEAKVFREDENGMIPCEDVHDCPIYDRDVMRKILQVGKLWNPYMTCGSRSGHKICSFEVSHSIFPIRVSGGKPLKFSTGKTFQGRLLPGQFDLSKSLSKINKKRRKFKSLLNKGDCEDPSFCRRGDYCCSVVWAHNRQFICPHSCF